MLSLWKLRVGVEAYYLEQVAEGLDEYYTGNREAPGRWTGAAAERLGLTGEVDPADLRAVMAGLAPGTGLTPNGTFLKVHPRRVPGFDLTFSVPKSVSVVYALGDHRVQHAVVEAGQAAVADALGWLEREACHVRRGSNSRPNPDGTFGTSRIPAAGFVAAEFRHRTSRAGDPQLHWHTLVANLAQGADGRWSSLDGVPLFQHKRAAGAVFQAALRHELAQRLPVRWGPVDNDIAEVAGIPERIRRMFSKRRAEIEEWLDERDLTGPVAAQQATLATRQAKSDDPEPVGLDAAWKAEAEAAGWGPDQLDRLLARTPEPDRPRRHADASYERWIDHVLGQRLVAHESTFRRHELVQAVAGQQRSGATAHQLDAIAQRVLASTSIVPINPDRDDRAWTWKHLLDVETRLVEHLRSAQRAAGPTVPDVVLDRALAAAPSLGDDQADAVQRLLGDGRPIQVLVGRAGTGKTRTLATVADGYQQAAWNVVGIAPSARAARELEAGAGIASVTVAAFLRRAPDLDQRTLVVMDEAGMCGTFDLAAAVEHCHRAGARLLLVGDPQQLPEVAAGGGFAASIDAGPAVELTVNRRQHEPWEIDALARLRSGDVRTAWDAYVDHDRVTVTDDTADLHRTVIEKWWQHRVDGEDVVILAGTRGQAKTLNQAARRHMDRTGQLVGAALVTGGRSFRVGDHVLATSNSPDQRDARTGRPARVDNGTLATVTAVYPERAEVTIAVNDTNQPIRLRASYLGDGHLHHGYAMTVHKAQGLTCDRVLVVGPAGLNRQAAYAALSRARLGAHLYVSAGEQVPGDDATHARGVPLPGHDLEPEERLLRKLRNDAAKTLAAVRDPLAQTAARLVARYTPAELEQAAAIATAIEAEEGSADGDGEAGQAAEARQHLTVGRSVRALDRDNIGTVLRVDDEAGTADIRFVSTDGRTAHRTLAWSDLEALDHDDTDTLTPAAAATLARRLADQEARRDRIAARLVTAGLEPVGALAYLRAAQIVRSQREQAERPLARSWSGRETSEPVPIPTEIVHRRLSELESLLTNDPATVALGPDETSGQGGKRTGPTPGPPCTTSLIATDWVARHWAHVVETDELRQSIQPER